MLHVLYLLFNEGYATSSGPDLARTDLSGEAIRLARAVRGRLPDDPEVAGLLALMLLTDARRPARTGADGELVPLAEQDRTPLGPGPDRRGRGPRSPGPSGRGQVGEYQVQAAIAAVHDQAASHADTDWAEILSLYGLLERMTGNPMVTLNRAVAAAMAEGPAAGLALLDGLDERLGDHHRPLGARPPARAGGRPGRRPRRVPGRGGPDHQPPRAAVPDHQGRPGRCGFPPRVGSAAGGYREQGGRSVGRRQQPPDARGSGRGGPAGCSRSQAGSTLPDRVWTVPNAISVARLAGVPVFLWLVLGPHADGWAVGPAHRGRGCPTGWTA